MATIAVVFGTTNGQAAKIALHVAHVLRDGGDLVRVIDTRHPAPAAPLEGVDGVVLVGSVRMGKFQSSLVCFVREHHDQIARIRSAFLAVSLSASRTSPAAGREVRKTIARFVKETQLLPGFVKPVAGALVYSRYPFFTKLAILFISTIAGGDTDTSRDYEYTDFADLSSFAQAFSAALAPQSLPQRMAFR